MIKYKSIAIDGPSGAGKSTVAKQLSKKIGYIYVDTGALYRTVGLYMISKNVLSKDDSKINDILNEVNINLEYRNNEQQIFLNNENVTNKIRTPEISMVASEFSSLKKIRDFLLSLQRNIARDNNIVMDGRDIATVVLPDADVKIFLTASKKSRAIRRYKELLSLGNENISFDDVYNDLVKRDNNDITREIAPLKKAKDAILVDSSNMSFDETLNNIYMIVKEKLL